MKNQLLLTAFLAVCSVLFNPIQISAIEYRNWSSTSQLISKSELREGNQQSFFQIKKKLKKAKPKRGWLIFWMIVLLALAIFCAFMIWTFVLVGVLLNFVAGAVILGFPCAVVIFLCIKGVASIARKLRKLKEGTTEIETR
jgi:Flp pilus assembly protein TadB